MRKAPLVFLVAGLSVGVGASFLRSSAPAEALPPARTQVNLADKEDAKPAIANLTKGQRAFTVKTQASSVVANPAGCHVDLLCVLPDPKTPTLKMTKIFLQDKLVIAVEPSKEPDHLLITVAVTPAESERLFSAIISGPVAFVYRKPGDTEIVRTTGAVNPFGRGNTDPEPVDK